MIKKLPLILTLMITIISMKGLHAQVITDKNLLARMSKDFKQREDNNFTRAKLLAKQNGWFLTKKTTNGGIISLIGVDELGNPQYVSTYNNTIAAATTRANQLWPGGSSGLNLSGSSNSVKGKIAIWDGGHPLTTHVELTGRITIKDGVGSVEGHGTHTTGTMIATGINPIAKGMAFGAQQLLAYDFNNDASEMATAAPNLLVSNHSYGFLPGSGWTYDGTNWDWYGDSTISKTDAYGFGYYDANSQIYDSIAYHSPNYLISVAAGNARGYNGPAVDSPYFYNGNKKLNRPATLKDNPSYTSVSNTADAKNVLVVGAVSGIPAGYNSPNDVSIAYFSSWGPTNDGRIKPDIVADGVDVTSTWNTSNTAYSTQSGTSMATPNATGSLYLLQEYYERLHPTVFMRSATLKGLAIHTADEAGASAGPDYVYGWGLLNVLKASSVITSSFNQQSDTIIESTLNSGSTYTFNITASGKGPLVATLVWTDPPATPVAVAQSLHNTKAMLVNDLDMRITKTVGGQVFKPWILDPANPANPATTGDNFRDNVEKINIDSAVPGQTYTITITNKGTLARGPQAFSLLASGIGGQAYCTSAPTSSAGTRIDSVSINNIQVANPVGCTTYTDNTKYTVQIQSKQKLPIRIKLSSCDASTANKVVKVFIDYNNNGVFDANELAAQSDVLNGNTVYTDTINTPSLTPGSTTLMRIVAEETSNASDVQACGSYGNGETQDYKVQVGVPTNDLALAQLIAPYNGVCSDDSELVVVSIRNNGLDTLSNVPVTAQITNGSSTVATLNEKYPGKIPPGFLVTYTFQKTFAAVAGTTYNVSAYLTSPNDQNSTNDTLTSAVAIAAQPAAPTATATVSGDTVTLKVTNPDASKTYFWYNSATSETPLFATTDTILTLSAVPAGNTFYVGTGMEGELGLKSKNQYPNGGSYRDSMGFASTATGVNSMSYTSDIPLILKSVKLYTGNPGKITIMVADTVLDQGQIAYYFPALSSTTIDVYATSPTAQPGARNNDPTDSGAIFYLNLPLPAGKHVIFDSTVDASVDKSSIGNASIFRNNNVTGNPYPFIIPNVISLTGNSVTAPSNFQNYYYYFYDMIVQTPDCISDRTAVAISVPTTPSGDFKFGPNPVIPGIPSTVTFDAGTSGSVQIELFDLLGRRCYSQNYSASGIFSAQINVGNLITGMYILSIKAGNKSYKQKILIAR